MKREVFDEKINEAYKKSNISNVYEASGFAQGSNHSFFILIQRIRSLENALEDAVTGLEWFNNEHIEDSKECDLERIEKWKKLLPPPY